MLDWLQNPLFCPILGSFSLNPNFAIEITKPASVIALWTFTKNHRLTYWLNSSFLQTPITQALDASLAILLRNSS